MANKTRSKIEKAASELRAAAASLRLAAQYLREVKSSGAGDAEGWAEQADALAYRVTA